MSRWLIEKSGTGIEKSGTGIEKSGTGIEKSGTCIEKSGTGIEKSGIGIRKSLIAFISAAGLFVSTVNAVEPIEPKGNLQIVAENGTIAVSWIIDGSVFSGAANFQGSYVAMPLTELSLATPEFLNVVGGGTGKDVVGGGTGKDVVGGGTGKDVVGGGTGIEVVGGGTGMEVVGGGTGVEVVGGGTGTDVVGGGTGDNVLVVGGGTGSEAIAITLPQGTGMHMEIAMGCSSATVSVMDSGFGEVVTFNNVPVIGNTGLCGGGASGSLGRSLSMR